MFSYEALDGARTARLKLFDKVHELKKSKHGDDNIIARQKYLDKFTDRINDDLNTPKALAVMWDVVKTDTLEDHDKLCVLLEFDKVLGFNLGNVKEDKAPEEVIDLAEKRGKARMQKDWKKSDELRDKINSLGWDIGDAADGYQLKKL